MKKFLYLLASIILIAACGKEPVEQTGQNVYTLDEVVNCKAVEDDINSFLIDLSLQGQGYNVSMSFKNNIEALPEGEYTVSSDLSSEKNCKLTLNDGKSDKEITHGKVRFALNNGVYTINIDLIVGAGAKYSFVYEGPITLASEVTPYKDVTLTKVISSVATPYEDGTFKLDLALSNETYKVTISLNYPEAILPTGEYTAASAINSMSECLLSLNDGQTNHQIQHGSVNISSDNGKYTINIDAIVDVKAKYPDVVIGCFGGGSNFGGIAFPFMRHNFTGERNTRFIAAEPASCPKLTQGKFEYDFGDEAGYTPLLPMFTLGHDFQPSNIHAGGLRYHGAGTVVSQLLKDGYMEAVDLEQKETFKAGCMFARAEGIIPAPESCHAIAAAIREAEKCKETGEEKVILFCLSGHGLIDMAAYDQYLAGNIH